MLHLWRLLSDELKKADKFFYRDPRTSHLPLLGSPWPMVCIIAIYVLFVTKWGPKFMEQRKPFNVYLPMQLYNIMQIILNLYVFVESVRYSYMQPHFKLSCQEFNPNDMRPSNFELLKPAYVYYMTKYLDLFDTLFFILRKKNNQISFLHVYHHAMMILGVWIYCTLLFASHYTATGCINSFIHVCMYTYYFLSALNLRFNLNTWKRRLTQLQILQFCYLSLHFAYPVINNWCKLEMIFVYAICMQNLFFLSLFIDFYRKTYLRKDKNKTEISEKGTE